MNIPFMAIYFASYEGSKQSLIDYAHGEETLLIQGVAGGLAGGAAAALTTPLDVVKTRLQLEGVSSPVRYVSMNVVRGVPSAGCQFRPPNNSSIQEHTYFGTPIMAHLFGVLMRRQSYLMFPCNALK
jgi:hypothetical protein